MNGAIKSYNPNKGYGFIEVDGGRDVFFHVSGVTSPKKTIAVGAPVRFETETGPKGVKGVDVVVVG